MKLNGFCLFLLLAHSMNISRGNKLEILKEVDGVKKPVSGKLEEIAGTNLTLICRKGYYNWYADDIFWGWERGNIRFNNVNDLKKIDPEKLRQFDVKNSSSVSDVVKTFHPLLPRDSGLYFCMNHFDHVFQIVELNVIVKTNPENLRNYLQALNKSQAEFNFNLEKNNLNLPKFLCTDKMFTCNSGESCVDYKYVCDGKKDCKDGSDENTYLCGVAPCVDKAQCFGGRCCCEKDTDLKCITHSTFSCCSEADFAFHNKDRSFKLYGSNDDPNTKQHSIATEAFIVTLFVIVIIFLGLIFSKCILSAVSKIRSVNLSFNQSVPSSTVSCSHTPNIIPAASTEARLVPIEYRNQFINPPSYDEAVACTQPSAFVLYNSMA